MAPSAKKDPKTISKEFQRLILQGESSRLLTDISPTTSSSCSTGLNAFEYFRIKTKSFNIWPPPLDHIVNFRGYLSSNCYAESIARNYITAIGYQ